MRNEETTFQMVSSFAHFTRHRLRSLLLTIPGERVMYPEYGVGLQRYLFEQNTNSSAGAIQSAIDAQIQKYMPFIVITGLTVGAMEEHPNQMAIRITYNIPELSINDFIILTI